MYFPQVANPEVGGSCPLRPVTEVAPILMDEGEIGNPGVYGSTRVLFLVIDRLHTHRCCGFVTLRVQFLSSLSSPHDHDISIAHVISASY